MRTLLLTIVFLAAVWVIPSNAHAATHHHHRHWGHYECDQRLTVKHVRATGTQRMLLARVLTQARKIGADRRVLIAAIITVTTESTVQNLSRGDLDSVGLFQIRAMHGSFGERHNPEWSTRWFVSRVLVVHRRYPRWFAARLAQAVQRSGFPGAYARWVSEARHSLVVCRWMEVR